VRKSIYSAKLVGIISRRLWSSWLVMMIVSVIGMIVCRLRVYYSGKLSSVVVSG